MQLDTFFRRLPPSPALHRYAQSRLKDWEKTWHRSLQLRLIFSQAGRQVQLELVGRDAAGHASSARCVGVEGFAAIDTLYRQLGSQGGLLSRRGLSCHRGPARAESPPV